MVVSLSLETQFAVLMFLFPLTALLIGFRIFLPAVGAREAIVGFLRTDWKYLGVAWLLTAGVNEAAHRFHAEQVYTDAVYTLEGSLVELFQVVTTPSLTVFFTVLYLVGFPLVVLFTYFAVKAEDPEEARRYALSYACLTLAALPFFVLFPVGVTAYYLPGVEALLYDLHPVIGAGIAATDTLVKAFPSLHAGLSILAALYARKAGRRYAYTAGALAVGITLSTLYLGIHWLSDIAFVLVLVGLAYWLSRQLDPAVLDPQSSRSLGPRDSPADGSSSSKSRPDFERR
jgi:membrane-associated phospholipid phosphatase